LDFFARQEQSRRTSRTLVGVFMLAFVVVALATTAVVAVALRGYTQNNALSVSTENWREWLAGHGGFVAAVALGTFGAMLLASFYRAASISRGGGQVARMLGATRVDGASNDPLTRRLVNVVEEMALASGVPVPEIYVLEQEAGINAFAAGKTPADAAIAVTRGALDRLERAELQGVIAHEFSHVLNGDMRLNQQLLSLSFGILVLSLVGRWVLRSARFARGGRRGRGNGVAVVLVIGVALTIIGGLGVVLSRLIKAGVARERERLADASAVQFTREPEGLAGALKKIGGHTARIESVDTEEVGHMLFEHGSRFSGWFSTHPPLLERIRALEPGFDPRDLPAAGAAPPEPAADDARAPGVAALAGVAAPAAALLAHAGEGGTAASGRALTAALPSDLHDATRSRDASFLVVLALALSADEGVRNRQLELLRQQLGVVRTEHCRSLFAGLAAIEERLRLPVLELAFPALKQRPPEQLKYLRELVAKLQELNPEQRLFDFALLRVFDSYLRNIPGTERPAATEPRARLDAREATRLLLRNVAAFGHRDATGARAAYAAGLASLGWPAAPTDPQFEPPEAERALADLDAALATLAAARPRDKERILRGVLATIQADAVTATEERELFRLIAAALDCPLPPDVDI
jgi:Zn-dependent protease with chaperone function